MKQKRTLVKKEDCNRELTYIRHKDNYPLQLKGNMKRKIVPTHKQTKIPSIKTYKDALSSSKSVSVLSALLLKSDTKSAIKQRRHFPANPEILNRFESIQTLHLNNNRVSNSKYRKITEDFQDRIDFSDMDTTKKGRSTSQQRKQKSIRKRCFPTTNLFLQSEFLGKQQAKHSQRRVNINRTKSSVVLN